MAVDALFQASTDRAIDDLQQRPKAPRVAAPGFSLWGTLKAAPRGAGAGVAESIGFGAEIAGAFGLTFGAYLSGTDPATLFETPEARQKREREAADARAKIDAGEAFSNEAGDTMRRRAADLMPDPETASAAEQVVAGLSRFLPKAIGYTVAGGPVVGAILTGVDEGLTEADKLKREGVDLGTRTKVGTVAGATAGAAVALPLAGRTVGQTAGLYALGGPGAFMGQQAASKAIIDAAGHDKVAQQYDPFDPVGLTLSTLVPLPFAAWGFRNIQRAGREARAPAPTATPEARPLADLGYGDRLKLRYDDARLDDYAVAAAQREGVPAEALLAIKNAGEKSGPTAVSPAGARGVMQFMPDTWKAFGRGDILDPVNSIDAAARFMRTLIDQYGGNVRAAVAHYNGGGKAGAAVARGEAPPARETRAYLDRTDAYVAQRGVGVAARAAVAADPAVADEARVTIVRGQVESAALHAAGDLAGAAQHVAAVSRAADQIASGERVAVDVSGELPRLEEIRRALAGDVVDEARGITAEVRAASAEMRAFVTRALADQRDNRSTVALSQIDEAKRARVLQETGLDLGLGPETIRADTVRHAQGRHSDLTPDDWAMLPWLMQNFDRATRLEPKRGHTGPRVALMAQDPVTGYAYVAEVHGGTKRGQRASVVTFFRDHPNSVASWMDQERGKATRAAGVAPRESMPPEGSPTLTPETLADTPAGSVAQSGDAAADNHVAAALERQAAEIERGSPDLMVQLDGMEAPMRLSEAMAAVRAEAAQMTADAKLLQVAAECALRST